MIRAAHWKVHRRSSVGMKRFCPGVFYYAVIRMDAVAMVEHFNDPIATAEARALETKKYLVYLVSVRLPIPQSMLTSIHTCFVF